MQVLYDEMLYTPPYTNIFGELHELQLCRISHVRHMLMLQIEQVLDMFEFVDNVAYGASAGHDNRHVVFEEYK